MTNPCLDCPELKTCWTVKMVQVCLENGIKVNKATCPKFKFVEAKK